MNQQFILSGGLGNQMFEYSLFLALRSFRSQISINTCAYEYEVMHNGYILDKVFGINEKNRFTSSKLAVYITQFIIHYTPRWLAFCEKTDTFDDSVFETKKSFIFGYWINPEYFKSIESTIRETFKFRNIDKRNRLLADEMRQCNSVSLHIRRGDYLKSPQYAVCNEDYYLKAISEILTSVSDPLLYVFSDDPEYCENFMARFKINYKIVKHNQGEDSYKDMYLMTNCKHNIIANSTFSWWGAWLNTNAEKQVICPKIWILGKSFNPCLDEWVHF